jgi:tRNA U34 5-methylaminomethyl-2-thiouridine-forming methyltransferase MnmC
MALITSGDGSHTLFSERYGVTYHSRFGAITESAHVFVAAGLRHKAAVQRDIAVLEAGFGTGLNAFMTWLEAERRNLNVNYLGLEIAPIGETEAKALNYAEALGVAERSDDFGALHRLDWGIPHALSEHFTFEKQATPIQAFEADAVFDVVYFDAFAPQAQPELWELPVFERFYRALKPEGLLVTYCAQGEFKRRLKQAGFAVERLQGPPGKREMTRALK